MAFNPQYTSIRERNKARDERKRAEADQARKDWEWEKNLLFSKMELEEKKSRAEKRQIEAKREKEKQARLDRHKTLQGIEGDINDFLDAKYETPTLREQAAEDLRSKYGSNSRIAEIVEAGIQGREDVVQGLIGASEEDLISYGDIKPVERIMGVTKSGTIASLPKGSSRFVRELNKHEKFALDQGAEPNSKEFETIVNLHRQGKFDEVEVIVPGKGPTRMELWQAEKEGYPTKAQYDWDKSQSERSAPKSIISALPSEIQEQAAEAYRAAGGGKDGLSAIERLEERYAQRNKQSRESAARENIPQALRVRYPDATEQELATLGNTVRSANSLESGWAAADKVRSNQVTQRKKDRVLSNVASTVENILSNDEWKDVVGNLEGNTEGVMGFIFGEQGGGLFEGNEKNAINDFDYLRDLLTAENLDMMSGVLSESDIKILANIGSGGTARTYDEDRVEGALKNLYKASSGKPYGQKKRRRYNPETGEIEDVD